MSIPKITKKFCPKCGVTIKTGIFCKECNPETLEFEELKIKLCPSQKYSYKGKWNTFGNLKDLCEELIKKSVKNEEQKKQVKIINGLEQIPDLLSKEGLKKDFELIFQVKKEKFVMPINVEITRSPQYAKVGSTYFEGTFQLRNPSAEAVSFIKKNAGHINKIEERGKESKEIDFYFMKKKDMMPMAHKLVNVFGGSIETNAKLFSKNKQTSKDIYRPTLLLTLPLFTKGDIILYKETPLLITNLGKNIKCVNLQENKKVNFDFNKNQKYSVLEKYKTTITQTEPELQVLNKEYQPITAKNYGEENVDFKKIKQVWITEHKNTGYILRVIK